MKNLYKHYFFLLFTTLGVKLIKPHTEIMISSSKSTVHIRITDPNMYPNHVCKHEQFVEIYQHL